MTVQRDEQERKEKQRKIDLSYLEDVKGADEVLAKYEGKLPNPEWNNTDLRKFLKPLKTREDGAMPTSKGGLLAKFSEWGTRKRRHVDGMPLEIPFERVIPIVKTVESVEESTNQMELTEM